MLDRRASRDTELRWILHLFNVVTWKCTKVPRTQPHWPDKWYRKQRLCYSRNPRKSMGDSGSMGLLFRFSKFCKVREPCRLYFSKGWVANIHAIFSKVTRNKLHTKFSKLRFSADACIYGIGCRFMKLLKLSEQISARFNSSYHIFPRGSRWWTNIFTRCESITKVPITSLEIQSATVPSGFVGVCQQMVTLVPETGATSKIFTLV